MYRPNIAPPPSSPSEYSANAVGVVITVLTNETIPSIGPSKVTRWIERILVFPAVRRLQTSRKSHHLSNYAFPKTDWSANRIYVYLEATVIRSLQNFIRRNMRTRLIRTKKIRNRKTPPTIELYLPTMGMAGGIDRDCNRLNLK